MWWRMPLRGKNWHIIGKIYHFNQSYIVSGPGQGWGWLGLGGCCTLPVGLRPCSGGNSRWSPRDLKPFANGFRGYGGPNNWGYFPDCILDPSMIDPNGHISFAISHGHMGHNSQKWPYGHYGHGRWQNQYGHHGYPVKEHGKTKLAVLVSTQ